MELYTKLFIAGGIIYTISVFLEVAMIIFGIAEGSPAAQVAPSIIGGFIAFCCFFVGLIIKKRCKADPNYKLPVFYRFFPVYGNLFIGFFAFMICAILLKAFGFSDMLHGGHRLPDRRHHSFYTVQEKRAGRKSAEYFAGHFAGCSGTGGTDGLPALFPLRKRISGSGIDSCQWEILLRIVF